MKYHDSIVIHKIKGYHNIPKEEGGWIGREFGIHMNALLSLKWRGTSLVAQWLRICLAMQGTRV